MIRRFISILSLSILLAACGTPAEPTAVADQPTSTSTTAPQPSATVTQPSATTVPPTLIPATPTQTATQVLPTNTPAPATATQTATAVTPNPTVIPTSAPTVVMPTATQTAATAVLTGTVSYPAGTLPPNAKLTVRLIGIPGIGQAVFGEQVFAPIPSAPVAFALSYDPARIDPIEYPSIYVEAEISDDEIVLFRTNQTYNVLNPGQPRTAALVLEPPANTALLSGMIRYPATTTLPADATLTIWIMQDDVASYPISQRTIAPVAQGMTSFRMQFPSPDSGEVPARSLHATLRVGGKILLLTNELSSIQPKNGAATIDLTLEQPTTVATVSGTVSYPAAANIPADARLLVQLQDYGFADGPPFLHGEQVITPVSASPVAFSIEYDPRLVRNGGMFSIDAQVQHNGRALFYNDMFYDAQLGSGTPVAVTMVPAIQQP